MIGSKNGVENAKCLLAHRINGLGSKDLSASKTRSKTSLGKRDEVDKMAKSEKKHL